MKMPVAKMLRCHVNDDPVALSWRLNRFVPFDSVSALASGTSILMDFSELDITFADRLELNVNVRYGDEEVPLQFGCPHNPITTRIPSCHCTS
jgi:hypothetical protein